MIPTVDDTNTFFQARNNSVWLGADEQNKLPSLYNASDYINAVYRVDGHQTDAAVQTAIMLLAAEMIGKPFSVAAPSQAVLSSELGAGNGAYQEKTTYAQPSSDPYPVISALLAAYGKRRESVSNPNALRIVRVTRG